MRVFAAGVLALSIASPAGQGLNEKALDALTVPADRLPEGCELQPVPNTNRTADGANPIPRDRLFPTNPWVGQEAPALARIRRTIDGVPRVPDEMPLDRRQAARYNLEWAAGVVEGYQATYLRADGGPVDVFAVRFQDEGLVRSVPPGRAVHGSRGVSRIVLGRTVVLVAAPGGSDPCSDAVRGHIGSLR